MRMARCSVAPAVLVALGVGCSASKGDGFRVSDGGDEAASCLTLDDCRSYEVTFANIALNCDGVPDVTSIVLTGPCATGDANPPNYSGYTSPFRQAGVSFQSPSPGLCHVELNFTSGFIYSTDVTFTTQTHPVPKGCPACPPFVGPAGLPSNPIYLTDQRATCLPDWPSVPRDAALADAPSDAHRDAAVDGGCTCPVGDAGGLCACKNFSLPTCPSSFGTLASCNYSGTCMGCRAGAVFICDCSIRVHPSRMVGVRNGPVSGREKRAPGEALEAATRRAGEPPLATISTSESPGSSYASWSPPMLVARCSAALGLLVVVLVVSATVGCSTGSDAHGSDGGGASVGRRDG